MHIKGIIPISPDSSIFLNQMPTYPHTQTPRESNLSSFIEERNSKLSVEAQSREEAGLSQISNLIEVNFKRKRFYELKTWEMRSTDL